MSNALVYLLYQSEQDVKKNWHTVVQAANPLHVHIRDNASTDNAVALFEQAGIPVHRNPTNVGFTQGVNDSIQAIWDRDWEWVYILNPDCSCPTGWDALIVDSLTEQEDIGIVGVRLVSTLGSVNHTGGIIGKPMPLSWSLLFPVNEQWSVLGQVAVCTTRFRHRLTDCKEAGPVPWVTFAAVAIRKKMIEQIGLLDPTYINYASDSEYSMRAWQAGWKVWYQPVTFQHEGGAGVRQAGSDVQEICMADLRRFARMEDDYIGSYHHKTDRT